MVNFVGDDELPSTKPSSDGVSRVSNSGREAVGERGEQAVFADVVFRAPERPPRRVSMLTPLLLAACVAHGQGHDLEEPTPPEVGDWCSPEEEAEHLCVGKPLKPEPVLAEPGPDGEPEASAALLLFAPLESDLGCGGGAVTTEGQVATTDGETETTPTTPMTPTTGVSIARGEGSGGDPAARPL
jgi:hypothetical protein